MNGSVYSYHETMNLDFRQASIYLDACLILAYLDKDDLRGDRIAKLFEKCQLDGICEIGISTHVLGEVYHRLLNLRILWALEHAHTRMRVPKKPAQEEPQTMSDAERFAQELLRIAGSDAVERSKQGKGNIRIPELLKRVRANGRQSDLLTPHYEWVVQEVNGFLDHLAELGFHVKILEANTQTKHLASAFMTSYLLDPYDALHYAVATQHGYPFLATLDSDFTHAPFHHHLSGTKILKFA